MIVWTEIKPKSFYSLSLTSLKLAVIIGSVVYVMYSERLALMVH